MNPDIKPPTPTPSNDTSPSTPPAAGDEAALQAIEALETETNEISGADTPVASSAPISVSPMNPIPESAIPTTSPVITEPLVPSSPEVSTSTMPSLDTTPSPLADRLNSEASATPTPTESFQPFTQPKKSKKKIIILVIVLVVLLLGAGGYFGWQYLQAQNAPKVATPTTQVEEETAPTDTETDVTSALTDMETQLTGLSDADYADTTLSDATLYN